jgi:Tol biopolymer transport system component/DNA-binding winged helix-turn-helix (wHTH) protein
MQEPAPAHAWIRFGPFELDPRSGHLRNGSSEQCLSDQPLALLNALLERPGEMVAREELVRRLWPQGTFVDFDHGLNSAISRLREALDDSANVPRFVETIPRRGYRLLVPVESDSAGPEPVSLETAARTEPPAADDASTSVSTDIARESGDAKRARSRRLVAMGLGTALVLAACVTGLLWWRSTGTRLPLLARVAIDLPADWVILNQSPAISPDSRDIVFSAFQRRTGQRALWLRPLRESSSRMVPHTEDGTGPFWSRDGRAIGFFAEGKLKVLQTADGGSPRVVCDAPTDSTGTWISARVILFGPDAAGGVSEVNVERGTIRPITRPDRPAGDLRHVGPVALPDGRHFVYVVDRKEARDAVLASVDGTKAHSLGAVQSHVLPTASGHVLFVRDGSLLAQRLDVAAARLVGAVTVLADGLAPPGPSFDGRFSVSSDLLVYLDALPFSTFPLAELRIFDRSGRLVGAVDQPARYFHPRLSPDGTRLAVSRSDATNPKRDLWVFDLTRNSRLQLTLDPGDDLAPRWSSDGRWLMFTSDRRGERDIYKRLASGEGSDELVFESTTSKSVNAWSADGRYVVYDTGGQGQTAQLQVLPLVGDRRPRALTAGPGFQKFADISPDDRLMAYASSESGRFEVFVETFPEKGGRWKVSTDGGFAPVWRSDGRELFFMSDSTLMAVDIHRNTVGFEWSVPRPLFKIPNFQAAFNSAPTVSADGQRFIAVTTTAPMEPQRLTTLLNWTSLVK